MHALSFYSFAAPESYTADLVVEGQFLYESPIMHAVQHACAYVAHAQLSVNLQLEHP